MNKNVKHSGVWTVFFTLLSVAYVFPIILVVINSFKKKAYISRKPFAIPREKMFVGMENYVKGIERTEYFEAFGWSLFITIFSVIAIILCTSMCAWYINRVVNTGTKTIYYLCLFSMIVPFQMVMFYAFKDSKYDETEYSVGPDYYLSGIRCRAFCIYVQRICKIPFFH